MSNLLSDNNPSTKDRNLPSPQSSPGINRRRFGTILAASSGFALADRFLVNEAHSAGKVKSAPPPKSYPLFSEAVSRVVPEAGYQSRIASKDSLGPWQKNVAARIETIPDLIPPEPDTGAACGL